MAEKTMDKLKKVFGFADEYEYEDEYEEEEYLPAEKEEPQNTKFKKRQSDGIHSSTGLIITVHEPLAFNEAQNIVDDLRANKAVVLNFEQLDIEVKRQIFHFVNGGLYAFNGNMEAVNDDIFILAPSKVAIDGLQKELENTGMFPWKN